MKAHFLFTCIILFLLSLSMLQADPVDADDLQFLLEREQYHLIDKYQEDFYLFASSDDITERKLLLDFAQRTQKLDLAADIHYSIARDFGSVEDGLQWLILQATTENDSILLQQKTSILRYSFDTPADSLVFAHYAYPELDLLAEIQALPQYNELRLFWMRYPASPAAMRRLSLLKTFMPATPPQSGIRLLFTCIYLTWQSSRTILSCRN